MLLFVEILNKYLYFFEQDVPSITADDIQVTAFDSGMQASTLIYSLLTSPCLEVVPSVALCVSKI